MRDFSGHFFTEGTMWNHFKTCRFAVRLALPPALHWFMAPEKKWNWFVFFLSVCFQQRCHVESNPNLPLHSETSRFLGLDRYMVPPKKTRKLMRDFSGHFFHRRYHVEPFLNLPPCSETCLAACTALVHGTRKKIEICLCFFWVFFQQRCHVESNPNLPLHSETSRFLGLDRYMVPPKKTRKLMRDFSGHFFHRRYHVEPFLNLPPCSETCHAACTALLHGTRKKMKFVCVFSRCFFRLQQRCHVESNPNLPLHSETFRPLWLDRYMVPPN